MLNLYLMTVLVGVALMAFAFNRRRSDMAFDRQATILLREVADEERLVAEAVDLIILCRPVLDAIPLDADDLPARSNLGLGRYADTRPGLLSYSLAHALSLNPDQKAGLA